MMRMNYKKVIIISLLIVIVLILFLIIKNKNVKVTWDNSITNYITLNDNKSVLNGNGAFISGNKININYSGTYEFTGTLTDGAIIVNIKDTGNVILIFNNINITSSSLPLTINNTKNTKIILKNDTINTLTDSNKIREEDGVIYSKDNLTIEGLGTLNINANYMDGIVSKDTLDIKEGTYVINSVDDGIRGKDYVIINNGNFTIKSGGDAIKSTNEEDSTLGYIKIEDGIFNIDAENDAFDAINNITINNGTFNIITGGGSENSSTNSMGMWSNSTSTGAKAIKANDITILNGTFDIDSSDDSIHSNNNLVIKNGVFNITSGDDGIHADTSINIDDGVFNILKSYEGIESANITINNGTYHINSSDDGINIAGGNDSSSIGRPGANNINTNTNQYLIINDGYIYIDSVGDGLDANGGIKILGGTVVVNGPTNDGNGSLDYDSTCIVDGGILISAGSSGMLQTPNNDSKLYTLSIVFDTSISSVIHIENNNGDEILTFKPSKTIESLVYTSSLLKSGETYNIYIDGTYSNEGTDGIYKNGTYTGTLYKTATISSKITSIGSARGMNNNMIGEGMRR